jgi:hypothetical protein
MRGWSRTDLKVWMHFSTRYYYCYSCSRRSDLEGQCTRCYHCSCLSTGYEFSFACVLYLKMSETLLLVTGIKSRVVYIRGYWIMCCINERSTAVRWITKCKYHWHCTVSYCATKNC